MIWTTQPRSEGPENIAYWRAGSGPVVVLIHGVGLRAEAWAALVPQLAVRYTVYAIDMPGHGQTPLQDTRTLDDFALRIGRFVTSLGQPTAVAGHSMGAIIALLLAAQHPASVPAVAALNAIYQRTPAAAKAVQERAAGIALDGRTDQTSTLDRWFGVGPKGPLADARNACGAWLNDVDPLGYKTAYTAFAHQDGPSVRLLRDLAIPALFMTAKDDGNSTPQMSEAMAWRAPMGKAMIVNNAAHMMPMTHPDFVTQSMIQTFERARHV